MAGKKKNELVTSGAAFLDAYKLKSPEVMPDKPFTHEILLLETFVAGIFHVRGLEKRLKGMKVGDRLILKRETKNEHDDLAVLILNQDKKKIGYIPRKDNQAIAHLLDAGKYLFAVLDDKPDTLEDEDYYCVKVSVYMVD